MSTKEQNKTIGRALREGRDPLQKEVKSVLVELVIRLRRQLYDATETLAQSDNRLKAARKKLAAKPKQAERKGVAKIYKAKAEAAETSRLAAATQRDTAQAGLAGLRCALEQLRHDKYDLQRLAEIANNEIGDIRAKLAESDKAVFAAIQQREEAKTYATDQGIEAAQQEKADKAKIETFAGVMRAGQEREIRLREERDRLHAANVKLSEEVEDLKNRMAAISFLDPDDPADPGAESEGGIEGAQLAGSIENLGNMWAVLCSGLPAKEGAEPMMIEALPFDSSCLHNVERLAHDFADLFCRDHPDSRKASVVPVMLITTSPGVSIQDSPTTKVLGHLHACQQYDDGDRGPLDAEDIYNSPIAAGSAAHKAAVAIDLSGITHYAWRVEAVTVLQVTRQRAASEGAGS